jgi:transcriptional regulatory protein RtcR
VRFSTEARRRFQAFATSSSATWPGNFRDLSAALTRMATLAPGGRITEEIVDEEADRLRRAWRRPSEDGEDLSGILDADALAAIDLFDRVQLAAVLGVCRRCSTISEAGRTLFAASRARRSSVNDADRLRKYLARFDLSWELVSAGRG